MALQPFNGELDPVAPSADLKPFTGTLDSPKRTAADFAKDTGISLLKGAISVPEAAVGIADIATGGAAGKAAEGLGFRPKEAKAILDEGYSEAQKAANAKVSNAEGFVDTVTTAVQNPSTILQSGIESLPLIGGGGVVGMGARALKASPVIAGAIGEGAAGAGMAAEGTRQQTDDGLLTGKQAGLSALSGVGTAALGAAGGKIAQKLGIADIDTLAAGGTQASADGLLKRTVKGAFAEGVFEELPQSVQEQILQNAALERPLTEGVDNAAAMGLLTGSAMGGGVSAISGGGKDKLIVSQGDSASDEEVSAQKQAEYDAQQPIQQPAINPANGSISRAASQIEPAAPVDEFTKFTQQTDADIENRKIAAGLKTKPENIPATDILGDSNVSDTTITPAGVVTDTGKSASGDIQGSVGNIPTEPAGNGVGAVTAAPASGIGTDLPAGTADRGNDAVAVSGEKLNKEWTAFSPESGTLNIPRSEMPQIKAEHRGAMVNFLNARDISHEQDTVPASSLKPTQQEFSENKVKKALDYEGGDRSILVSSDNHVLDGHHQWLAKLQNGENVDVIRLNAPIKELLTKVAEFPSAETAKEVAPTTTKPAESTTKPAELTTKSTKSPTSNPLFEQNKDLIQSIIPKLNWAVVGNKRIDDANGNQIGRSKFVPMDEGLDAIRAKGTLSYNGMQNAVNKALRGEPLSKQEHNAIDALSQYVNDNKEAYAPKPAITAEQEAAYNSKLAAEPDGTFDQLFYGEDTQEAKQAVKELTDDELIEGVGKDVPIDEFEAWLNAEGIENEQKTDNGRTETQTGSNVTDQENTGNTQNAPANQAERAGQSQEVRAIVEAIIRRRKVANELNKLDAFDNYLAEAKKLLNGGNASVTKFRLAATTFKADQELVDAFNQLINIVSPQAKADKAAKANHVETYKQRIADAKSVDELRAIQKEISKDNTISDRQLETLDDLAMDAQDKFTEEQNAPDTTTVKGTEQPKSSNDLRNDNAARGKNTAKENTEKQGSEAGQDQLKNEEQKLIEKYNLPEATIFKNGMGFNKSKWLAEIGSENSLNYFDKKQQAAEALSNVLKDTEAYKLKQKRDHEFKSSLATIISRGDMPTFGQWKAALPFIRETDSYIKLSQISSFLHDYLDVPKNNIMGNIGDAASHYVSDFGTKYPVVLYKRLPKFFGEKTKAENDRIFGRAKNENNKDLLGDNTAYKQAIADESFNLTGQTSNDIEADIQRTRNELKANREQEKVDEAARIEKERKARQEIAADNFDLTATGKDAKATKANDANVIDSQFAGQGDLLEPKAETPINQDEVNYPSKDTPLVDLSGKYNKVWFNRFDAEKNKVVLDIVYKDRGKLMQDEFSYSPEMYADRFYIAESEKDAKEKAKKLAGTIALGGLSNQESRDILNKDNTNKLSVNETKKDEVTKAAEALTNAGVTGKEKLDTIKDVREGKVTAEEVADAYGVAAKSKVDDYGEKLEGARKDMVRAMAKEYSDDEIASLPLSKLWPVTDINLIENKTAAAIAFAAREEIPSKPRKPYAVKVWVGKVKVLREIGRLVSKALESNPELMLQKIKDANLGHFKSKVALLEAIDRDAWKRIGKVEEYPNAYSYVDGVKQIKPMVRIDVDGVTTTYEASSVADVIDNVNEKLGKEKQEKRMAFEVRGSSKGGYFINKKGDKNYTKLKTFDSSKEAFEFLRNNYDEVVAAWDATKDRLNVKESDVRNKENRPRTGEDYRKGKDVSSEEFATTFGFRGIQFGEWVKQGGKDNDRQGALNAAYDALMDLANIINVPPKALSLEGTLGLSFGARGKGSASAHFEPNTLVINLTKTQGAGTLAHEWFHALDNYFSRKRGGEKSMAEVKSQQAYREGNFITYKPEALYINKNYGNKGITKAELERYRKQSPNSKYWSEENWILDPKHPQGVRPEVEVRFADLVDALNTSPMKQRARSIDGVKEGTDGYWSRIIELGARAFENYVIHKMQLNGYDNDYLANVVRVDSFNRDSSRFPYLLDEEVAPVAEAFDNLFSEIQTKETDNGNVAMFSRGNTANTPTFYSALTRAVQDIGYNKAAPLQWKMTIKNLAQKGVKPDEIEWTGINDWLDLQQGSVTKEQVLDYLNANGVQVTETMLGDKWRERVESRMEEINNEVTNLVEEFGIIPDLTGDAKVKYEALEKEFNDLDDRLRSTPEYVDETKYDKYTLPGGNNYKELLLTLPADKEGVTKRYNRFLDLEVKQQTDGLEGEALTEFLALSKEFSGTLRDNERVQYGDVKYKSSHFSQPNILAHVRFDKRVDADGNKTLFIQEIQSDFGQDGKKHGFKLTDAEISSMKGYSLAGKVEQLNKDWRNDRTTKEEQDLGWAEVEAEKQSKGITDADIKEAIDAVNKNKTAVPRAPFVTKTDAWVSLALKRMLRYAAENGFDKVAIINGKQAGDLYSLAKQVDEIIVEKLPDGTFNIKATLPNGGGTQEIQNDVRDNELEGLIGKDLAKKVINQDYGTEVYDGGDLEVGNEGMIGFYDKIVPKVAKDVLKKLGGNVEEVSIKGEKYNSLNDEKNKGKFIKDGYLVEKQTGFTITPEMREKIMGGLPLFNRDGSVKSGLSKPSIQAAVNSLRNNWKNAPEIIVVDDMNDPAIRKAVRDENERQLSQGAQGQPEAFFDGGKVYIVADEMNSADDVIRVVFHETLGHFGLRGLYGKDLGKVLDQVAMLRPREMKAKAKSYGLDLTKASDKNIAAEEILAEMAQTAPNSSFVKRAIAIIRQFLRDIGVKLELTDNDIIVNYLIPARNYVVKGTQKEQGVKGLVAAFNRTQSQTDTPQFKAWFGDSKVVDADAEISLMLEDFEVNLKSEFGLDKLLLTYAGDNEVELSTISLPKEMRSQGIGTKAMNKIIAFADANNLRLVLDPASKNDKFLDGVTSRNRLIDFYKRFGFKENKGKSRDFSISSSMFRDAINPDIRFSRSNPAQQSLAPQWQSLPESKLGDNLIYALQDKHVDLKRVSQAIKQAGIDIADRWNAYLQEELFHGRAAKRTQDFIKHDLDPLIQDMRMRGVKMADFEEYLWARHAEERNIQIAKINPEMPDGGSGMKTQEARDYLANLSQADKTKYEALARRIDLINRKSRQVLLDYGLESADTIAAWEGAYKNYVPLMREDMDAGFGNGTGQGFSVKGNSSKRATGSNRAVVDIIANIAQQYEKNIIRGEKNRVSTALIGLAKLNPNDSFWKVDTPPMLKTVSKATGLVEERTDPNYKNRNNVIVARIPNKLGKIEERSVVFNEFDERAMRMAESLKNLDQDQIGELLGTASAITRYFSSINTQYNPIFGIVNITRDVQGALLNLSTTPIADKKKEVLSNTPKALKGIYQDLRSQRLKGVQADSEWARLFEEFQNEGGQTGYRDMFRNAQERSEALKNALDPTWWQTSKIGKVISLNGAIANQEQWAFDKAVKPIFQWLEDYNNALENAVRVSVYKVALDNGHSKQQAASMAKNISVNFNRKGQMSRQIGSLYAFFGASVQGTARIADTLTTRDINGKVSISRIGKRIVQGGLLLGAMQAVALAAAGYGDDEPPEFVRDRSIIIPFGDSYITIPMPLGYNAIPSFGRILTEWALSGFENSQERLVHVIDMLMDVTNPIGNAGLSLQTISPTVIDPIAALAENKDFTGRPIARQDFNSLDPTPGFTRAKDTASALSKGLAYGINALTGGTDYKPGAISPTPDQIDYLFGQVTGGVGREAMKVEQTATSIVTGEDLPTYKVPVVGRFYGDTKGQSSESSAFYNNLRELKMHENQIKGMAKAGEDTKQYRSDNPESVLITQANYTERVVQKLRKNRRALLEKDAPPAEIQRIDARITELMHSLNQKVKIRKNE